MKKPGEVLFRIDEPDTDIKIFPATEEQPAALCVWVTVLEGEYQDQRMKFYGRWGSEKEQFRVQSAAKALGMDASRTFSEVTADETFGIGNNLSIMGAIRFNERKGWPEIRYIKEATVEDVENDSYV